MRRSSTLLNNMLWVSIELALAICVNGQSLKEKLEETDAFYQNYGKETYSKVQIEKDVVGLYDYFGSHIVDGVHIYELSRSKSLLSNQNIGDSIADSRMLEYQKSDFFENFSKLVITQDAVGRSNTSFIIGDQIKTRFTPLTFNMSNFHGIRWDWWSTGLKFSMLMSQTRPGFSAKKDTDGQSLVEHPITTESFPEEYYARGYRGDKDFTNKSPYGDFDFLIALHAENRIANAVDVGVTYINHQMNDVNKVTSNPFQSNVPDSLMPNHIHFEFYDLTPNDTLDAGVYVEDVAMSINGKEVVAKRGSESLFRRTFAGDRDNVLLPRDLPLSRPQNGPIPIIVEFKTDPQYWSFRGTGGSLASIRDIKTIQFKYSVAGNYLVFVSTDRQIPAAINGIYNPQTRRVDYSYPTRSVGGIYDNEVKVDASGGVDFPNSVQNYSTTYFGDYIAMAPRKISVSDVEFSRVVESAVMAGRFNDGFRYNYREYTYSYNVNSSSVVYGLYVKGELGGVVFSGEVNLKQAESMLPGSEQSRQVTNMLSGNLKAQRNLGNSFSVDGEVYRIPPNWMPTLQKFQASRYFNQTTYKSQSGSTPDYRISPRPLGDQVWTIEDNDDNDAFPENEARRYPSDLNPDIDKDKFYNDGTLMATSDRRKQLTLPGSNMAISYDDPDGVVASKSDRNRNGIPDFFEDFLLYNSDAPVFELGMDLNNNGLPDFEDDDILPDFGYSLGYVITGDGIKTQGIQGGKLNIRWLSANQKTTVDLGAVFEGIVNHDISPEIDPQFEKAARESEGRSQVGYLNVRYQLIQRSRGLLVDMGNELRVISDAIRNDVVVDNTQRIGDALDVNYWYRLDPLNFRRAVVDNLVGTVIFKHVNNFEEVFRFKLGAEQHLALPDSFYYPLGYDSQWKRYDSRTIGELHLTGKLQYTLGFKTDFTGWLSAFNFLEKIRIIPQYKLSFSMRKEIFGPDETQVDPRDLSRHLKMDIDHDGIIDDVLDDFGDNLVRVNKERELWDAYAANNQTYLLNVPILRVAYSIAENTELQIGGQLMRQLDMISPENDYAKYTLLAQIVSKAYYKGYGVTFFFGGRFSRMRYDIYARDAVLSHNNSMGSNVDLGGYELFAKLYSGL